MTDHDVTKQQGAALANDGRGAAEFDRIVRPAPTQQLGVGGTVIVGGYIQSNEQDRRLQGTTKYRTFSETLANVSIVAAGVRFFLNLVAKAEWRVVPPEESGTKGEELAELVDDILHDMGTSWHRVVRRAAMYRFYGFSIQEWTAKRRPDGTVGFLDVEPRPQVTIEKWQTNLHGDVEGVVQVNPQNGQHLPLPREKLVYIVDDSLSDSPEGLGLFRHLVEPSARLRRYEQLEGFGYELDLRGVPVARAPYAELDKLVAGGQLTASEREAYLEPLTSFITNHIKNPALGLMIDSQTWATTDDKQTPSSVPQYDIKLLDGGQYSLEEIADAIRRVTLEIARVLGVEHLLLGDGSAGSWALSKDKSNNFALIVDSTLKELREAFEKDLLGPLWKLNGWDDELMPELIFDTKASRDIEQLSTVIRDLASAGVVLDREDEAVQALLELMGLPRLMSMLEKDPDMQLAGGPAPTPADPAMEETPPTDGEPTE